MLTPSLPMTMAGDKSQFHPCPPMYSPPNSKFTTTVVNVCAHNRLSITLIHRKTKETCY